MRSQQLRFLIWANRVVWTDRMLSALLRWSARWEMACLIDKVLP